MPMSLLVVEDKATSLQHVIDILQPLKFSITTAKDGLDGLSKAKQDDYDMVLIDHKMPVMDGINLLKSLRQLDTYCDAPLFFMTTQELTEVEPLALKAGATQCFGKPLKESFVVETLRSFMQRSVA